MVSVAVGYENASNGTKLRDGARFGGPRRLALPVILIGTCPPGTWRIVTVEKAILLITTAVGVCFPQFGLTPWFIDRAHSQVSAAFQS
jgi:hypothetical protein